MIGCESQVAPQSKVTKTVAGDLVAVAPNHPSHWLSNVEVSGLSTGTADPGMSGEAASRLQVAPPSPVRYMYWEPALKLCAHPSVGLAKFTTGCDPGTFMTRQWAPPSTVR